MCPLICNFNGNKGLSPDLFKESSARWEVYPNNIANAIVIENLKNIKNNIIGINIEWINWRWPNKWYNNHDKELFPIFDLS